jgi:hypothetical protein
MVARRARRRRGDDSGGIAAARETRAAAVLNVLGLDGMALFRASDPVESLALQAVGEESARVLRERDKALAAEIAEIANAVSRLFK